MKIFVIALYDREQKKKLGSAKEVLAILNWKIFIHSIIGKI